MSRTTRHETSSRRRGVPEIADAAVSTARAPAGDEPEPTESLPPVARNIIAAAERILLEKGFQALTFKAVAQEAGEYPDSIRYYFANKAGLVRAVALHVSQDIGEETAEVLRGLPEAPQSEEAILDVACRVTEDSRSFRVYWELLPHILRSEALRSGAADVYERHRAIYCGCIRAGGAPDAPEARQAIWAITSLFIAISDGLALQSALDPTRVDVRALLHVCLQVCRGGLAEALRSPVKT